MVHILNVVEPRRLLHQVKFHIFKAISDFLLLPCPGDAEQKNHGMSWKTCPFLVSPFEFASFINYAHLLWNWWQKITRPKQIIPLNSTNWIKISFATWSRFANALTKMESLMQWLWLSVTEKCNKRAWIALMSNRSCLVFIYQITGLMLRSTQSSKGIRSISVD